MLLSTCQVETWLCIFTRRGNSLKKRPGEINIINRGKNLLKIIILYNADNNGTDYSSCWKGENTCSMSLSRQKTRVEVWETRNAVETGADKRVFPQLYWVFSHQCAFPAHLSLEGQKKVTPRLAFFRGLIQFFSLACPSVLYWSSFRVDDIHLNMRIPRDNAIHCITAWKYNWCCRFFAAEIICGLEYLHLMGVIHRFVACIYVSICLRWMI